MKLVDLLSKWEKVRESSTLNLVDRQAFEECYDFIASKMLRLCDVPGCEHLHHGHGYCKGHLERLKRRGELTDRNGNLLLKEYKKRED